MKKIDLGQMIGILANVGVIAGIIFLAVELQQNQRMVMAQTRNEIARMTIELQQVNRDPEQARIIIRGNAGEQLTDVERFQLNRWADVTLRFWENMEYQYRQGLFDEEEYLGELQSFRNRMNGQAGLRARYCASRESRSSSFVSAADSILNEKCSSSD